MLSKFVGASPEKSNDTLTHTHAHKPELAEDSALIIYLFSFQVK